MKLKLILTTAIMGGALALPGFSTAAQTPPPTQDSVVISDAIATFSTAPPPFPETVHVRVNLQAQSGPEGENPTGHYTMSICGVSTQCDIPAPIPDTQLAGVQLAAPVVDTFSGAVQCLEVSGNKATIVAMVFQTILGLGFAVADNGTPGAGRDTISVGGPLQPPLPTSAPCGQQPPSGGGFVSPSGEITVIDAQPLPTTTGECKDGGWQQFGFGNQGQCVAFVNHQQ
jgi:hypothetical protein